MRTPVGSFTHRPKNLFGVLACGDDDIDVDGHVETVVDQVLVEVTDDIEISEYASDSNDSDWEPPPTVPSADPSTAPVDPSDVLSRFREQVHATLTPRGRATTRGKVPVLKFLCCC